MGVEGGGVQEGALGVKTVEKKTALIESQPNCLLKY